MQIHYAQPIHQMKDRLFSFIIIKEHEINKEGGLYHKQEEKLVHHVVCELFCICEYYNDRPFFITLHRISW